MTTLYHDSKIKLMRSVILYLVIFNSLMYVLFLLPYDFESSSGASLSFHF